MERRYQFCAEIIAPMYSMQSRRNRSPTDCPPLLSVEAGQEAYAYNALVIAWPEILTRVAELHAIKPEQGTPLTLLKTTGVDTMENNHMTLARAFALSSGALAPYIAPELSREFSKDWWNNAVLDKF